ncbi:unnamed protein product [Mytilus coruscus]|uniref:Cysteine and tyrosine-rich protein 1 n=1 Tax=Mytilus coruscus TaxID=42192 RepID=A0A6J8CQ33_MYTCO|nr:unnamed protein product [Mytilus coruscus]
MGAVILMILLLISLVDGQSCYLGYHSCTGYDWCCPDAYICTGSSTCLSIGAIVGACIGAIVGLVFFIVLIYLCYRSKKGTVGTVVVHPGVHTTVVGQQQYGQPVYGQPPQYGHPQYSQPQYSQPQYSQPQYGQPSGFAQPGQDPAYPPTKQ